MNNKYLYQFLDANSKIILIHKIKILLIVNGTIDAMLLPFSQNMVKTLDKLKETKFKGMFGFQIDKNRPTIIVYNNKRLKSNGIKETDFELDNTYYKVIDKLLHYDYDDNTNTNEVSYTITLNNKQYDLYSRLWNFTDNSKQHQLFSKNLKTIFDTLVELFPDQNPKIDVLYEWV